MRAGTRANSSRKTSDGVGPMARRTRCGGVRTASQTLRAPSSASCTAMSAAEFPAPTTRTSRPRKGQALRKSPECRISPAKWLKPGQGGTTGVWYLPVASTTAGVRICPDEVSTSQPPAAWSMRLTSHPSASATARPDGPAPMTTTSGLLRRSVNTGGILFLWVPALTRLTTLPGSLRPQSLRRSEPWPPASRVPGMPSNHRVVDHIVGHLAGIGVDYIFGVDGANIEDLYDAAYFRSDLTAVPND